MADKLDAETLGPIIAKIISLVLKNNVHIVMTVRWSDEDRGNKNSTVLIVYFSHLSLFTIILSQICSPYLRTEPFIPVRTKE